MMATYVQVTAIMPQRFRREGVGERAAAVRFLQSWGAE